MLHRFFQSKTITKWLSLRKSKSVVAVESIGSKLLWFSFMYTLEMMCRFSLHFTDQRLLDMLLTLCFGFNIELNRAGMMKCREMMFRKALLPVLEKPFSDECRTHSPNMHCFKGGDSRTNEQPGNTSVLVVARILDRCFVRFLGLVSCTPLLVIATAAKQLSWNMMYF